MLFLAAVGAVGCYEENPITETELTDSDDPAILTVSPENGAAGVVREANYTIQFDSPMDTASVGSCLHLVGGDEMRRWLDSLSGMRQGLGMSDSDHASMMTWLDSIDYTGHIEWNDRLDSCTFHPGSLLAANTDHILFLDSGVYSMDGHLLLGWSPEFGGHMFYFRTGSE